MIRLSAARTLRSLGQVSLGSPRFRSRTDCKERLLIPSKSWLNRASVRRGGTSRDARITPPSSSKCHPRVLIRNPIVEIDAS
jgi:hypothetical protein